MSVSYLTPTAPAARSAGRITPLALLVIEGQALRLASKGSDIEIFK